MGTARQLPIDYLAPVWIPDEFADKCMVCGDTTFGFFNRKVHFQKESHAKASLSVCLACSTTDMTELAEKLSAMDAHLEAF